MQRRLGARLGVVAAAAAQTLIQSSNDFIDSTWALNHRFITGGTLEVACSSSLDGSEVFEIGNVYHGCLLGRGHKETRVRRSAGVERRQGRLRRPRGEEVDDTCGDGGESGVEHMEAPGLSSTNDPQAWQR